MKIQKFFDEYTLNLPKNKLFFFFHSAVQIRFLSFISGCLLGILLPSLGSRTGANKTPGNSKILSIKRMVSQHLSISFCKTVHWSYDLDLFPLVFKWSVTASFSTRNWTTACVFGTWPTRCFASSCYCQSTLLQWLLSCRLLPSVFFLGKK